MSYRQPSELIVLCTI